MRWFLWTLIGWNVLSVVLSATVVGKPRKPLEASTFAVMTLVSSAVIAGLLLTLERGVSPS
jgi:hypothetical protein